MQGVSFFHSLGRSGIRSSSLRLTAQLRSSRSTCKRNFNNDSSRPSTFKIGTGTALFLALASCTGGYYASKTLAPISKSSSVSASDFKTSSIYAYDSSASTDLPHRYGSKADFASAIAEIKGHFSKTTLGGAEESYEDYVFEDEDERFRHGFDEIGHDPLPQLPSAVVYVRDTEDVVKLVEIANKYSVPLIPYSGGTSLEAHFTAPYAGISVDMSRMDKIISYNSQDADMVVEAGAKWETINDFLSKQDSNLFFPLDPGPGATIGGMISTGCSGTNAVRYGTARHGCFLSLTAVLPSGEVITTRSRARKSSAGPDLTNLFIGAEGTLGIITSATIRLSPLLPISVGYCSFPSVSAACSAVQDIVLSGAPVQCVELLDENMLKATNNAAVSSRKYEEKHSLFFKLSGSEIAMKDAAETIEKIIKKHGSENLEFAQNTAEMEDIWQARKNALWSAKGMSSISRVWTTDVCVPLGSLPALIEQTKADMEGSGLSTAIVSHAADGNFHGFLAISQDSDLVVAQEVVDRMARRAQELGGTCTGEHGIGNGKKKHLRNELGDGTVRLLKTIKKTIDPKNLMNPGKLYPS